ncbi:MAG: DEAD/DEAH box helicase [Lautropia sp.]|nr:DEAD/DEAH box helicase [Lautropia sp.]
MPAISIALGNHPTLNTGPHAQGMRVMQARVYQQRHAQYLLIKSPPASGKSRALMYVALDKLHHQGIRQVIIAVPERSIGSSFANEPLRQSGFFADWHVAPRWNLCNAPGGDDARAECSKVRAVSRFLRSTDQVLVCTHATFRFAVDELGIEALDGCLIAIDEFHHVSSNTDNNKLGRHLKNLIERGQTHLMAMTGSYFRGDGEAVLSPDDEARFTTVTYSYYEQLAAYQHLKSLDICHHFYNGPYLDSLEKVLDPSLKTIIHIPNVNARESLGDKAHETNRIIDLLGKWEGQDARTGFHQVRSRQDGRMLKIANLVNDDDLAERAKVLAALKDPEHKNDRDHVDIIIALGMAKEGFDWIWCEHALTIGYRSSLTEVVQIIGRATRDAPGKTRARFTNLLAEPTADEGIVTEAVNDTLKAISASLLMEQVMAPNFNFTPRDSGPLDGFDYGEQGYQAGGGNTGYNATTGTYHIQIKGLTQSMSEAARQICRKDLNDLYVAVLQDPHLMGRALFDQQNTLPEETTQLHIGKIIRDRYPQLEASDHEAIRQHLLATVHMAQQQGVLTQTNAPLSIESEIETESRQHGNTAFIDGSRRFLNVQDLDIDLIDSRNPFGTAYALLAKTLNESTLKQIQAAISAKRCQLSEDEARELTKRALRFKQEQGRAPSLQSPDPWEQKMAQGMMALANYRRKARSRSNPTSNAPEAASTEEAQHV